jgi:hypothetical protein
MALIEGPRGADIVPGASTPAYEEMKRFGVRLTRHFALVTDLRRTDGAGGFLLSSIRCSFRRSPSSRNLLIMFAAISSALSGASLMSAREL